MEKGEERRGKMEKEIEEIRRGGRGEKIRKRERK